MVFFDKLYSIQGNAGKTILFGIEAVKLSQKSSLKQTFDDYVDQLLLKSENLEKPIGTIKPEETQTMVAIRKRDPKVKAWILLTVNSIYSFFLRLLLI